MDEGLAIFDNPETEDYNDYASEEISVFLLQYNKLLDMDDIIQFLLTNIEYTQASYLVEYLFDSYEIEKIKELWQKE
ncbi:MAG: hypothetical protein LBV43_09165 [Prevotella sp.]|nr:hypothetical protein [Prevotella sp.]